MNRICNTQCVSALSYAILIFSFSFIFICEYSVHLPFVNYTARFATIVHHKKRQSIFSLCIGCMNKLHNFKMNSPPFVYCNTQRIDVLQILHTFLFLLICSVSIHIVADKPTFVVYMLNQVLFYSVQWMFHEFYSVAISSVGTFLRSFCSFFVCLHVKCAEIWCNCFELMIIAKWFIDNYCQFAWISCGKSRRNTLRFVAVWLHRCTQYGLILRVHKIVKCIVCS